MRRRGTLLLGAVGLIAAGVLLATVSGARYRVQAIGLKLEGALPEMSWSELVPLLGRKSALEFQTLVETRNPFEAVTNPLTDPGEVAEGQLVFRKQCALCHGAEAQGDRGPSLAAGVLKQGESDWALFRTIRHGVPGTAMPAHNLPATSVWRIVAYLRALRAGSRTGSVPADGTGTSDTIPALDLTFQRLKDATHDSGGWLMYSGTYNGQRHSRLSQIRPDNVARLQLKWIFQFPEPDEKIETTPLVVGGTMYVTTPSGDVWALDARSGARRWVHRATLPNDLRLCCGAVNRGVAILGNTLVVGTLDAHLVALDARTGAVQWDVTVADYRQGFSISSAPLALEDRILIGVSGGEFGFRGFLDAYQPRTGARLWRFNTVPGPGEPGHETWAGDSWRTGGAPAWLTGTYDPDLGLVYWGVGNPSPNFRGESRIGANLYSNSVVALEAATGRLRWYFQFTPHDEHDWDGVQIPVLADVVIRGQPRKVIYQANRNGHFYALDRTTGQFLYAENFVKQTWSAGFDSAGRPRLRPEASPTRRGSLVYPGVTGGTNWWSPSYDAASDRFFVPALDAPSLFFSGDGSYRAGDLFLGSITAIPPELPSWTSVRALAAATGKLLWEHRFPERQTPLIMGGLLSTDGGLVFAGDLGQFIALDAATGKELWQSRSEGRIVAAPITYLSQGRQLVSIVQGRAILTFSIDGR